MMLRAKLPLLFHKEIPTVDIYFRGPLKHLITMWQKPSPERPIQRLGPYCFYANGQVVIVRYATKSELSVIRTLKPEGCIYVIDDDLWSMEGDTSLPDGYHQYLASFKNIILPQVMDLADMIVTPNELINRVFEDKKCLTLDPAYTYLCQDFSHFDNPHQIDMIFTGSHTHLADLGFVAPVLADLCERHENLTLTTFLGKNAPQILTKQKNITNHAERSWPSYKKFMKTRRFHIALAPYRDTRFNKARSINKLFDHAAFGAAGLYSPLPPISTIITHDENGLLVKEKTSAWQGAMENLIEHPDKARRLARAGVDLARTAGDPARTADFWKQLLGL